MTVSPRLRPAPMATTAGVLTPPGRGGIAVVLLRGPHVDDILRGAFLPMRGHSTGGEGTVQLGRVVDADGAMIDEALVHRRAEYAEINIHGGPAAVRAVMERLRQCGADAETSEGDASLAMAHERWNNPAVAKEMLAALEQARCMLAVRAIAGQWSHGLSELAGEAIAACRSGKPPKEKELSAALRRSADALPRMRRLLEPADVVIAGPPNAGKSTLANALVGRHVSIVHEIAGTTRDWVRELAILGGVAVWLTDTAGLWDAPAEGDDAHRIDAEAVRRARDCVDRADLVLLAGDAQADALGDVWRPGGAVLRVWTKADISPPQGRPDVVLSTVAGQGLDALADAVLHTLGLADVDPESPMAFTDRQAGLLQQAADALDRRDIRRAVARLHRLLVGEACAEDEP